MPPALPSTELHRSGRRRRCCRCRRPDSHCLCASIVPQATRTPICILQHSDESSHPFTTALLAQRGASSVRLLSGVVFPSAMVADQKGIETALNWCLLYAPHSYHGRNLSEDCVWEFKNRKHCLRLPSECNAVIVLDGTWRNTRELLLRNPWLASLPVLSLFDWPASIYRLRKSQKIDGVSTIEACAALLQTLESSFSIAQYLQPLKTLLTQQQHYRSL